MGRYIIRPDAIKNSAIEKRHLDQDALNWITNDGFKKLGSGDFTSFGDILEKLDDMYGKSHELNHHGHFRASIWNASYFDIINSCCSWETDEWVQIITGNLVSDGNGGIRDSKNNAGTFVRYHTEAEGWTKWEATNDILSRLQGKSRFTNPQTDSFKYIDLGNLDTVDKNMQRFIVWLDSMFDAGKIVTIQENPKIYEYHDSNFAITKDDFLNKKEGYYRINVNNKSLIEVQVIKMSSSLGSVMQVVKGPVTIKNIEPTIITNVTNITNITDATNNNKRIVTAEANMSYGTYNIYHRVYYDYTKDGVYYNYWTPWVAEEDVVNEVKNEVSQVESELIKRLQGTSKNNHFKDPFKDLNISPENVIRVLNGETKDSNDNVINLTINDLTPRVEDNKSYNTGNYRSYSVSGSSFLDLKIYALDWKNKKYMQSVFGPITCTPSTGKLNWVNGLEFGEFYRVSKKVVVDGQETHEWSEWKIVNCKNIQSFISVEQQRAEEVEGDLSIRLDEVESRTEQVEGNLSSRLDEVESKAEQVEENLSSRLDEVESKASTSEEELLKRLQGTSDYSNGVKDPFKFLGNFNSVSAIEAQLDTMNASGNSGVFRAVLAGYISIIIVNNPMDTSEGIWNQTVMGCLSTYYNSDDKKIKLKNNWYNYSVLYRTSSKEKGWGDWKIADEDRIKDLIKEISEDDVDSLKEELIRYIKGNNTSAWEYPFKKIQDFTNLKSLDNYLKGWHGESIEDYDSDNDGEIEVPATKGFVGNFRTNVAGIPIEIFSSVVGYGDKTDKEGDTSVWVQELRGAIDIDCGSINHLGVDNSYGFEYTDVENGATDAVVRKYKYDLRFASPMNNTGGINTLRRIYNGTLGGWGDWINVANPYITSPLYGKNVLILGGSFAHNTRAYMNKEKDDNTGFGFDEQGRKYSLQNYIAKSLGLKRFDNFALAGNGVCIDAFTIETKIDDSDSDSDNDVIKNDYSIFGQLTRAIEWSNGKYKYDAIIIMGGINDYGKHVKLGYISDSMRNDTFYGSYKRIIDTARRYNKDVKLYMTTPFKAFHSDTYWAPQSTETNAVGVRYQDYVQALKVIAQYKSIPLLDIFSIQQVDTTNYNEYYRVKANDHTHPNGKGYKMIASALIDFLAWGKGMCTFDFDVLSYKNRANIKANSESIAAEEERAKKVEDDIKNQINDTNDEVSELLNRIQGNSTDSISFDPFIKLSWEPRNKEDENDTKPDINDYMNDLCPSDNDYVNKTGHFRAYSKNGTSCLDIKVDVLSWGSNDGKIKERFMQTVSGPVTLMDKKLYWVNAVPISGPGYYYRLSERIKDKEGKWSERTWSEWKPVNNSYIESLQDEINSLKQKIDTILNTIN